MTRKDRREQQAASPGEILHRVRRAAAEMGLTEIQGGKGLFARPLLRARSGTFGIEVEAWRRGDAVRLRILVTGLSPDSEGLRVHRVGASPDRAMGAPAFDQELRIEGQQAALAFAVLDDPTRWRLADLLRGYVAVEGREPVPVKAWLFSRGLKVIVQQGQSCDGQALGAVLRSVLDIAHRLRTPDDVAGRIAANLRSEHEPGVRLRCVLLLAREFPRRKATRKALLAARQDPDDEVRLQAGWYLGEEGGATLLALVESERTEDSCAARAVNALGERLAVGQAEAALGRALEWGRTETARACLAALERRGALPSEGLLLQALGVDDLQISVTATRALGRVGTVTAVTALRAAESSRRGELRSAARQAIAEIQSRLPDAQPGQLSLAGSEAGALSLAPGEPGRLSLSEPGPVHPHLHAAEPEPVLSQEQEPQWPTELAGRLA